MKEGTSIGGATLFYGGDSSRGRQEVVSAIVPEDVGLSLRRVKPPRSRFDIPYPLNPVGNVGIQAPRWDSEGIGHQPPNVAILEDYLLEDEETQKQQKNPREKTKVYDEPDDTRLSQWRSISDKPAKKTQGPPPVGSGPPVRPPDPPNIGQGGWHPVGPTSAPPPTGFPDSGQPPPGFSGYGQTRPTYGHVNFFPYDYQPQQQPPPLVPQQPPPPIQQQYVGYQPTFYQGFSASYNQEWGNQQPPPPGLGTLPDMTQPPPSQSSSSASTVTAPIVSPIPAPEAPPPPQQASKKVSSPEPVEMQRSVEEKESAMRKDQRQQAQDMLQQREDYLRKSAVLTRELELLQEQKEVLLEETATDNSRILKENSKLQEEIKNKLKAINNVVGMLSKFMIDKTDLQSEKRKRSKSSSKEPQMTFESERKSSKRSSSSSSSDEVKEILRSKEKVNYTFFDPEEHWCQVCNVFPTTAKEFLNHLHSEEHKETIMTKKLADLPWHKNNPEKERTQYKGAPNKRIPIKGLQFFISSTAWFCKLCDAWIGDLHCASLHLKSEKHMDNYEDFLAKNKDWEETWSAERLEAMNHSKEEELRMLELVRVRKLVDDEGVSKQRLESTVRMREGWGEVVAASPPRVRESLKITVANDEVPDSEDLSRSIRVAMRNKSKTSDPKSVKPMGPALPPTKKANPYDTSSIPVPPSQSNGSTQGQWAFKPGVVNVISESEKQLMKTLKDKFKQKQDKEDMYKRDERKERKMMRDRRFRDRSFDRSRSRSRSRGRTRSRSRGRDYSRERDYDRERSHSRERRRRRRSSSPRRGHSRSRTPEQRKQAPRKIEPKQWVAPPSSPPPYITRKPEDKEKWDKPKKKAAPNPVASIPKSKYGFIGRMPGMAKKKHSDKSDKSSKTSDSNDIAADRRAPEDMEIDSGASDSEPPEVMIESAPVATTVLQEETAPEEEEEAPAAELAKPAPGRLPQDFQDALRLLFPNDAPIPFEGAAAPAEVVPPVPVPVPPAPPAPIPVPPSTVPVAPKQVCNISQEELLMLGIDPEDVFAQGLFN